MIYQRVRLPHGSQGNWRWTNAARNGGAAGGGARWGQGQQGQNGWRYGGRRTIFSLPRTVFGLIRLPFYLAGAGAGAAGYTYYKINEGVKEIVPDWLTDSLGHAKDWLSSIDLSNVKMPELPSVDLSGLLQVPKDGKNVNTNSLLGPDAEEAAKNYSKFNPMKSSSSSSSSSSSGSSSFAGGGGGGGGGPNPSQMPPPDQDLMVLTRKLIEVRNLLKTVNNNANLQLPSIVVIGSQSSGKSSVLEAIVGHEFLPKGNNMVTRRPIELTLIHTPESKEEYGEFPQLGIGKVKDFNHIQKTLTDLNMAVSDAECVSANPIELRIFSPNVPDLTMVDLPGYIQIHNRNQPAILKEKIADLCESYIREQNIILAVCSADVDLANSEALRASRKVDPSGQRTIGVVTKMDLVDPDTGVGILKNKDYPLQLGYVGVVCKGSAKNSRALIRAEDAYFRSSPAFDRTVAVGTPVLRRRLMEALEEHMGRGLHRIVDAVQTELEDARYQFKVHYNDRRISAESYVAEAMDSLKTRFKSFTKEFGKPQVREEVRAMLERKIRDLCDDVYWADAKVLNLPKLCADPFWQAKLDLTSASLTKSGIGRASVQLVVDVLAENMDRILSTEHWQHHPEARGRVLQFANEILRSKFHTTVDQVENTIKPYKFEVECTEQEWAAGAQKAQQLLDRTLAESQRDLQNIKASIGRRKLRNAMRYVQKVDKEAPPARLGQATITEITPASSSSSPESSTPEPDPSSPFNVKILEKARSAIRLQDRITTLQSRSAAVRSRQCMTSTNRACCPEVFLEVVSDKLTYTAVMFIYVELLNEFFFQLPREIDNKLYYDLSKDQILKFARENPSVAKHLEVQDRKATLELVMEKLRGISRR
ncbi:dynamin-like GTPase mgm1 [Irineochytrium annulatum]|nr:dynamin-like GTPase mgm1 [Irineochytrium annulatum]